MTPPCPTARQAFLHRDGCPGPGAELKWLLLFLEYKVLPLDVKTAEVAKTGKVDCPRRDLKVKQGRGKRIIGFAQICALAHESRNYLPPDRQLSLRSGGSYSPRMLAARQPTRHLFFHSLFFFGVFDAIAGPRPYFEARISDGFLGSFTKAVFLGVKLCQGPIDLAQ